MNRPHRFSPEVFGPYTLLARLGYGGMAEVFLARATSAGGVQRFLAIKRLLPHCAQNRETVRLLLDEARIAIRLRHPNIVQVFDFGRIQDAFYLAMEYVDGIELREILRPPDSKQVAGSAALPLDEAFVVAISILEALACAHEACDDEDHTLGIVHRDVSPHNVMVSRNAQVKLTDFGVARARISTHASGVGDIRGKFSFMPPEQLAGAAIDSRVDLFALGAVFYELICGHQPFRSANSLEQQQQLAQTVPPPSRYRPSIPKAVDEIALRALQMAPEDRFQSAREFAESLREELIRSCGRHADHVIHRLSARVAERAGPSLLADDRIAGAYGSVSTSLAFSQGGGLMVAADFVTRGEISLLTDIPRSPFTTRPLRHDEPKPAVRRPRPQLPEWQTDPIDRSVDISAEADGLWSEDSWQVTPPHGHVPADRSTEHREDQVQESPEQPPPLRLLSKWTGLGFIATIVIVGIVLALGGLW